MAARQGIKLKDHTILALDIGSRFIKVAELRLSRGMISLLNVAVRPTPDNVLNTNQILDPVGLGRAVKELLATNKIKTKKVIVAVSGQSSVVVRPIDLPKMTTKELADTMKFEVERHIPFTADEVVMDYAPLVDPDELPETESNMKVLLAVAQEELVKAYLKMLGAAGLQPLAMDVEILSAIRSLVDIRGEHGGYDETVALVNIGALSTDISIVDKGNVIFTRSVPIAGNTLTEAIADQMGRNFDEAEEIKKELGCIYLEPAAGDPAAGAHEEGGAGFNLGTLPTTEQPDSLFGSFGSGMGSSGLDLPAEGAGALGSSLFSLEDEFNAGGLNFGAGEVNTTPPAAGDTPLFGAGGPSAMPFEFDDDVDDDIPLLRLGDEEEEDTRNVPTYRLDADEVDDDVQVPPSVTPQPTQNASTGPVFDLSSELENQMPPPLSRPASSQESVNVTPSTPAPSEPFVPFTFDASANQAQQGAPYLGETASTHEDAGGVTHPMAFPSDGLEDPFSTHTADIPHDEMFQRRIFESMLPTLLELVAEIRRSLEYYSSREPDTPVQRIITYGGTSRLPNLAAFFTHEIGLEVQVANPVEALDLSAFRQPQDYLQDLAPALPVCIGLGLRDMIE